MTRADRVVVRRDRRRTEREERRERRQRSRAASEGRSSMLTPRNLTLLAIAAGLVGVIAFALLSRPSPSIVLREPTFSTPVEFADGLALGEAGAPVTVEVWSDFQCPACATFTQRMEPLVVNDYVRGGQVRLVYRDMSFLGPESLSAAIAARVAAEHNLFWPYHDYLFVNQVPQHDVGNFSQARLEAIATAIGLDLEAFRAGQSDPGIIQAVTDVDRQAQAIAIVSTPTIVVGDQRFTGVPATYAELKQVIDAALAEAGD